MTTLAQLAYRANRFAPAIAMRNAREQAEAAIDRAVELYARTPDDETELRKLFGIVMTLGAHANVDRIKASAVAQGIAV